MLVKIKRGWELPESAATPEDVFHDRRRFLKAGSAASILLAAPALLAAFDEAPSPVAQAAASRAPAADERTAVTSACQRRWNTFARSAI